MGDVTREALPVEPEAAPQRAVARDRDYWLASRRRLQQELERLRSHRWSRDVTSELRAIERQLERVDRLLRA
jgi:hypothetical protein